MEIINKEEKQKEVVNDIIRKLSELSYDDKDKRLIFCTLMLSIGKFIKQEDYDENLLVLDQHLAKKRGKALENKYNM